MDYYGTSFQNVKNFKISFLDVHRFKLVLYNINALKKFNHIEQGSFYTSIVRKIEVYKKKKAARSYYVCIEREEKNINQNLRKD